MIRREKNIASSALLGVAAIQATVTFLGWFLVGREFTILDWIITFGFAAFFALAIVARWARIPAAVIAATLYGSFLLFQGCASPELLTEGLIFKVPIVLLLVVALVSAFKRDGTNTRSEDNDRAPDM